MIESDKKKRSEQEDMMKGISLLMNSTKREITMFKHVWTDELMKKYDKNVNDVSALNH